jgi:tetratricopeptide (TPR) repeat protein
MNTNSMVRILRSAGYILLVATIIAVPFFLDANSNNYFIPKIYVFVGLTMLGLVLFGVESVLNKGLAYTSTPFDVPFLALLLLAAISAIFGISPFVSFLGRSDYFVMSFVLFLSFGVFAALLIQNSGTSKLRQLLNIALGVGFGSVVLFILRTIFKVDVFDGFSGIWNTVDVANTNFGVWVAVFFVAAAGQLLRKNNSLLADIGFGVTTVLSFVALLVMGFGVIWWLALGGLLLLVVAAFFMRKVVRMGFLAGVLVLATLIASFVAFGSPRKVQAALPLEAALGAAPSWNIVSRSIMSSTKNFTFGNGSGSFAYSFSKFRDPKFNYDKTASSLRFNYPYNSVFALVSEFGSLFVVGFVFFIVYLLAHLYSALRNAGIMASLEGDAAAHDLLALAGATQSLDIILLGVPWLVLTAGMGLLFYGFTLWWLWWFFTALILVAFGASNPSFNRLRTISLVGSTERSSTAAFVLFASGFAVLGLLFVLGRWYLADHLIMEARAAEFPAAEEKLNRSIAYHETEIAHVALAAVYLKEASRIAAEPGHDPKAVNELSGKAVVELKKATAVAPKSVVLWENLAALNKDLLLAVPEARDQAIDALLHAQDLEPSNAEIQKLLGDLYAPSWLAYQGISNDDCKIISCDWAKAAERYRTAYDLKNDFPEALSGLTNAYERMKEPKKALDVYTELVKGAPQDVPSLYNYGRLLYNRNNPGDRDAAEKIWLAVIDKEPNYSNALYSLGLVNELRGDKKTALQYFLKVRTLNPLRPDKSNIDAVNAINAKIKKLQGR